LRFLAAAAIFVAHFADAGSVSNNYRFIEIRKSLEAKLPRVLSEIKKLISSMPQERRVSITR